MFTETTEANKNLVRRFVEEVFNNRNLDAIEAFLAPDLVDHTLPPSLPPTTEGSKQGVSMFLKAFPDLRITIDDLVAEGDRVIIRYTSRGVQRGSFGGLPPSGRRVEVSSYLTARIANGKIVEMWGLDDRLAMIQQLGMIPAALGAAFLAGLGMGIGLIALWRRALT